MPDPTPPSHPPHPPQRLAELAAALERGLDDARAALDAGRIDDATRADLIASLTAAVELQREAEALLARITNAAQKHPEGG